MAPMFIHNLFVSVISGNFALITKGGRLCSQKCTRGHNLTSNFFFSLLQNDSSRFHSTTTGQFLYTGNISVFIFFGSNCLSSNENVFFFNFVAECLVPKCNESNNELPKENIIFQILWKSRCDILVSFPSHLKKYLLY